MESWLLLLGQLCIRGAGVQVVGSIIERDLLIYLYCFLDQMAFVTQLRRFPTPVTELARLCRISPLVRRLPSTSLMRITTKTTKLMVWEYLDE